jgi:hypothetical protein
MLFTHECCELAEPLVSGGERAEKKAILALDVPGDDADCPRNPHRELGCVAAERLVSRERALAVIAGAWQN